MRSRPVLSVKYAIWPEATTSVIEYAVSKLPITSGPLGVDTSMTCNAVG